MNSKSRGIFEFLFGFIFSFVFTYYAVGSFLYLFLFLFGKEYLSDPEVQDSLNKLFYFFGLF